MATSTIKDLCEQEWDAWKSDCSGFLKAVAADLGISLSGQANHIIDIMGNPPWHQLGHDATKAAQYASQGYLVVAGLKATGNGHVAIVVPGAANPYPLAYWGRLNSIGKKNKTLNWSWTEADLPHVNYYAIKP